MDDTTILGGVLNQLGQTVKQTAKQVVKLPQELAGDVGEQIGGTRDEKSAASAQGSGEPRDWKSDEDRVKFLKDLYGTSQPSPEASVDKSSGKADQNKKTEVSQTSANPLVKSVENKQLTEFQEQIKDKSPEEQKQLMELRNQLHREVYYDPLVNPSRQQEERPAEKVENEKKQEMMDLQEKEAKKPQPIAVVREQNKAEQFRGAAG